MEALNIQEKCTQKREHRLTYSMKRQGHGHYFFYFLFFIFYFLSSNKKNFEANFFLKLVPFFLIQWP